MIGMVQKTIPTDLAFAYEIAEKVFGEMQVKRRTHYNYTVGRLYIQGVLDAVELLGERAGHWLRFRYIDGLTINEARELPDFMFTPSKAASYESNLFTKLRTPAYAQLMVVTSVISNDTPRRSVQEKASVSGYYQAQEPIQEFFDNVSG